ncbi:alkyl sulfatase C-terminal domain-containing protein [Streptomyces sp. NPDC096323]|uniref:alkyl sulfatase C-terminal domain-containing protein n=1 Tax=Streptomyces sp. NPDC096323 TaxID=3155822 RepID=UPI003319A4A6
MDDARRGFMGTAESDEVSTTDGTAVWDLDAYGFLAQDCPPTANPSLWRQSRLVAGHAASADLLRALTLDQLFDALSIRVDGPRSWDADITVRWNVTGGEPLTLRLHNGVLTHIAGTGPAVSSPDVELALDEAALRAVLLGGLPPSELAGRATITGDAAKITELLGHLSAPDPDFPMVTP